MTGNDDDAVPDEPVPDEPAIVPAWGAGFRGADAPQTGPGAPFAAPPSRTTSRARKALIAGGGAAAVAGVVALVLFTGHRGPSSPTTITFTVPAQTFSLRTTVAIPLDEMKDPGCAAAEDAFRPVTEDFAKDLHDQTASVADVQKAIDRANEAAGAVTSPALKSAVDTMRTHLVALRAAARAGDFGSAATDLESLTGDIDAVYGACGV